MWYQVQVSFTSTSLVLPGVKERVVFQAHYPSQIRKRKSTFSKSSPVSHAPGPSHRETIRPMKLCVSFCLAPQTDNMQSRCSGKAHHGNVRSSIINSLMLPIPNNYMSVTTFVFTQTQDIQTNLTQTYLTQTYKQT